MQSLFVAVVELEVREPAKTKYKAEGKEDAATGVPKSLELLRSKLG